MSENKSTAVATEPETTSEGHSTVVSLAVFVVLFAVFCAGLYIMSLFTVATFLGGLALSILALFVTFELVPRFMK